MADYREDKKLSDSYLLQADVARRKRSGSFCRQFFFFVILLYVVLYINLKHDEKSLSGRQLRSSWNSHYSLSVVKPVFDGSFIFQYRSRDWEITMIVLHAHDREEGKGLFTFQ